MSLAPEGRRLLRVEARNAEVPVERKPEWIKAKVHMGPEYIGLKNKVKSAGLHTVCEEAGCPNIFECWEDREATFLIGGDICTRRCDFCDITSGKPRPLDMEEPQKVAENIREMDLRYATVTGVARDDQKDGAAWLYAETIRRIHALNPGTGVEILPPDFGAVPELVQQVFDARPEVFAHNLETVPRIFKRIRPAFTYEKSLRVLTMAKADGLVTKSNLILGMGETLEQRAEFAANLAELNPHEVPLNFLNPRPGTPFGDLEVLPASEALKAVAAFRLALPRTMLRFAGGREITLGDLGAKQGILGGINAVIVGNYLTTLGRPAESDLELLDDLQMPIKALNASL